MIKPILNTTVIIRTPRFPYDIELLHCWEDLKSLIRDASPDFYQKIANLSYGELKVAEPRVQETVNKYFNRAKYRGTPFGSFATLSVAAIKPEKASIYLDEEIQAHSFINWKYRNSDTTFTQKECKAGFVSFSSNTTFYKVGGEMRFLRKVNTEFEIATIDYDEEIEQILLFCRRPQIFQNISLQLTFTQGKALFVLLRSMVDAGLLLTSKHSNIIGEDYLQRIKPMENQPDQAYIIAERKIKDGSISSHDFRHLPALALKMQQLNSGYRNEMLDNFIDRFNTKFEGQLVPINIALDPEVGIGYGNLAQRHSDSIMGGFTRKKEDIQSDTRSIYEGPIIEHITDPLKRSSAIQLDTISNPNDKTLPLPNTIGVLCTVVDGNIYLDSMGGITANALMGRFAFGIPEIKNHCLLLADMEQEANPDVIFFDVGYTHEDEVDNINRRPAIYPSELSILNYSFSQNPLSINDIYVSVRNGMVILQDRCSGKRVVPRFASAYNYKRSDLSVFRFLMDVQDQGICKNMMWRPDAFIPNLSFYPRVLFKNIIVAPAMWRIKTDIFDACASLSGEIEALRIQLSKIDDAVYFKFGSGDQTLFIDKHKETDLKLLHSLLKKSKSLYLEEAALPQYPKAYNTDGKPFLTQYNVTMQHNEEVIPGVTFDNSVDTTLKARQWLMPGGDWLYFEIFGEPYRLESILESKIASFLKTNRIKIEKWFFIRYNEGGEHLRLRIKMKNKDYGYDFLSAFSILLEHELNTGIIADFQIKTYKREIHRYSSRLIDDIEAQFMADSDFVVPLLKSNLSETQRWRICLDTLHLIRKEIGLSGINFELMVANITRAFNEEFKIENADFKEVNRQYKLLQNIPPPDFSKTLQSHYTNFQKSFIRLLFSAHLHERSRLFIDLFHMHVNRTFITNQRFMEMLIYNFFQLDLTMEKKRQSFPLYTDLRA